VACLAGGALVATQVTPSAGPGFPTPAGCPQAAGRRSPDARGSAANVLRKAGFSSEKVSWRDPLVQDHVGVTLGRQTAACTSWKCGPNMQCRRRQGLRESPSAASRGRRYGRRRHILKANTTVSPKTSWMPRIAFPLGDGVLDLVLEDPANRRTSTNTTTRTAQASPTRRKLSSGVSAASRTLEWQPGRPPEWALDNLDRIPLQPVPACGFRAERQAQARGKRTERRTVVVGAGHYGKIWWVDGGGEIGPVHFQAPIAYGAFTWRTTSSPTSRRRGRRPGVHRRHAGRHAEREW